MSSPIETNPNRVAESQVLILLWSINTVMFVAEMVVGIISQSSALIADSLDMFADAVVYGIGFYAVQKSLHTKAQVALFSGFLEVLLGISVLLEVLRRIMSGSEPNSMWMIIMGSLALMANVTCVMLLAKHRHGDLNIRATWIFSKNDVIANIGVLIAGGLVAYLGTPLPDYLIACLISIIIVRGGVQIVTEAHLTLKSG